MTKKAFCLSRSVCFLFVICGTLFLPVQQSLMLEPPGERQPGTTHRARSFLTAVRMVKKWNSLSLGKSKRGDGGLNRMEGAQRVMLLDPQIFLV